MFNCSSEIAPPNQKVIFSLLEQGRCMMYEGTCFVAPGQEIGANCSLQGVFFCLASTPSTNQIRVMTCSMTCQIHMIGQQCDYTTDRDLRACDKQAAIIIQHCNPTAAQKPAAAQGNTMSVRRHIRGVSELTIRHRG